ncbi:MAG: fibronectin type III domain-containing protein [Planctomycetaceae bacterium]
MNFTMQTTDKAPRCDSSVGRLRRLLRSLVMLASLGCGLLMMGTDADAKAPAPPTSLVAADNSWDAGELLQVSFKLSPDDRLDKSGRSEVAYYLLTRSGEFGGIYQEVGRLIPTAADHRHGTMTGLVQQCVDGEPYWFRLQAVNQDGEKSPIVETPLDRPAVASVQMLNKSRGWLALITAIVCGSVVIFILMARSGRTLYIRKIAGLEAVEEAVGRATEMGKSVLFVPGILDMNDIQTIAGLTVLSHVARQAAEYEARVEVPTSKSLVMTAARETVEAAFLSAGRPDAYNEDDISYVTDEQFGYVAYLTGEMVREKPAACFYMGAFFAESLILAETGNAIGAIQVAGTAQPSQLPFFVAACDFTLIGEEFFAASAYLSHDPDQLGSLKGQDVGKLIVGSLMILGVTLVTLAGLTGNVAIQDAATYLVDTVLFTG